MISIYNISAAASQLPRLVACLPAIEFMLLHVLSTVSLRILLTLRYRLKFLSISEPRRHGSIFNADRRFLTVGNKPPLLVVREELVDVVGFEPTEPLGNGVTARLNTPTLTHILLLSAACTVLLGKKEQYYQMERVERIELSALAWKAKVLPLYDTRV
jgi:hypothetical protein